MSPLADDPPRWLTPAVERRARERARAEAKRPAAAVERFSVALTDREPGWLRRTLDALRR
jgi:hypothetical protein